MLRNGVAAWIGIGWRNQSEWGGALRRNTQTKRKLLAAVIEAIEKAKKEGVSHPIDLMKKALNSRRKYMVWKARNTKLKRGQEMMLSYRSKYTSSICMFKF